MASQERNEVADGTLEPRKKILSKSSVNVRSRYKFSYKNLFSSALRRKIIPTDKTQKPVPVSANEDVAKKVVTYDKEEEKQQKLDRERRGQISIRNWNKAKRPQFKHEPEKMTNKMVKKLQAIDNISPILIDSNVLQNALKSCKEHRHDLASGSPLKIPCKVMLDKRSRGKDEYDDRMPTLIISPTPVNSTMINEALREAGLAKGDKAANTYGIAVEPSIKKQYTTYETDANSCFHTKHTFMFSPNTGEKGICVQRGIDKDNKPIQIFPATLTLVDSQAGKSPTIEQLYPIKENSENNFPDPIEIQSSTNGPAAQPSIAENPKEHDGNGSSGSFGNFAQFDKCTPDDTVSVNSSMRQSCFTPVSVSRVKSFVSPTPTIESSSLDEEQYKHDTGIKHQDQQNVTHIRSMDDDRYTLINELFFSKPFTSTESSKLPEKTNPVTCKVPIKVESRSVMMNIFVKEDEYVCGTDSNNTTSRNRDVCNKLFVRETPGMGELSESDPMLARVLKRFKKYQSGETHDPRLSCSLLDPPNKANKMVCREIVSQNVEVSLQDKTSLSSSIETNEPGMDRTRQTRDGKVFLEKNRDIYNRFYSYLQEIKSKKDNTNVSLGLFGVDFKDNSDNNLQQIENEGDYDNPDYITNQRLTVPRHRYSMQTMSESSNVKRVENEKLMTSKTYSFLSAPRPFVPQYSLNYETKHDKVPCYSSPQEPEYDSSNTRTVYKISVKPSPRQEESRGDVEFRNKCPSYDQKEMETTDRGSSRSLYKINLSPSPVSMKEAIEAQTAEILKCIYHMGSNKFTSDSVRQLYFPDKYTLSVNQGPWSKNTLDVIRKYEDEQENQETPVQQEDSPVDVNSNQEEDAQSTRMTLSESTALGHSRARSRQPAPSEVFMQGSREQRTRSALMCPETVCEALLSSMTMLSHFDKRHASVPFMVVNTSSSVAINVNPAEVVRDECRIVAFFHVIEKMDCGPFVLMMAICSEMQDSLMVWLLELNSNSLCTVKILTPDTRNSNDPTAVSYTGPTISPRDVQGLSEVIDTGCYVSVNGNLLKRMLGKNSDVEITASILV